MNEPVHADTLLRVGDSFVPARDFSGPLARDYVEGAIELVVNGKVVASGELWTDDLDLLWSTIVQSLGPLRRGEAVEIRWPDQPIRLAISPQNDRRLLVERGGASSTELRVSVDSASLIDALLLAAFDFAQMFERFRPWSETESVKRLIAAHKAEGGLPAG